MHVGARQLIDSMLQVLPSDRASLRELCADAWTVADEGPMEVEDSVLIECAPSPALVNAAGGPCSWLRSERGRRAALYTGYALIVGALLLFGSLRHDGSSSSTDFGLVADDSEQLHAPSVRLATE